MAPQGAPAAGEWRETLAGAVVGQEVSEEFLEESETLLGAIDWSDNSKAVVQTLLEGYVSDVVAKGDRRGGPKGIWRSWSKQVSWAVWGLVRANRRDFPRSLKPDKKTATPAPTPGTGWKPPVALSAADESPAGSSAAENVGAEIEKFAQAQGADVTDLVAFSWPEIAGLAASSGLSLGARLKIKSMCRPVLASMPEPMGPPGTASGRQASQAAHRGLDELQTRRHRGLDGTVGSTSSVESGDGEAGMRGNALQKARRNAYKLSDPVKVYNQFLSEYAHKEDWPVDTEVWPRMAEEFLSEVYGQQKRGAQYANDFIQAHNLQGCHQLQVLPVIWTALDAMLLYDNVNPVNAYSAEVLLRHAYGLEKVYADCWRLEDTRGDKSKCKWHLLPRYCLVRSQGGGAKSVSADKAAKKQMMEEADFLKYNKKLLDQVGNG